MNNKKYEYTPERIFSGTFPIEQTVVITETAVVEGDIVGLSSANKFGKLDATYSIPYGVAYTKTDSVPGAVEIILTGSLHTDFVKLESGKEEEQIQKLRLIGIFVK